MKKRHTLKNIFQLNEDSPMETLSKADIECSEELEETVDGSQDAFVDNAPAVVEKVNTTNEKALSEIHKNERNKMKKLSVNQLKKEIMTLIKEEMTEWPKAEPEDPDMVDELLLYAENDGELYRTRFQPVFKNLKRKVAKGVYDPTLAAKLWTYVADAAAQKYEKEFGMRRGSISPATRRAVGVELEKRNRDEVMKGQQPKEDVVDPVQQFATRPMLGPVSYYDGDKKSSLKKKGGSKKGLKEQMGSGDRPGRFGPLGLSMNPQAEGEVIDDEELSDLDDPTAWELDSMGLSSEEDEDDPMSFPSLEDEGDNTDYGMNEIVGPSDVFVPDDENAVESSECGMKEAGKEYWKDPSYVAEKVDDAVSCVTYDDPNAVSRFYSIVRDYAGDLETASPEEAKELYEELADYFISHMTDENPDYVDVALEPDDPETGRSALDAAGMYREEAYTFQRMDPVELGKAIVKKFSR